MYLIRMSDFPDEVVSSRSIGNLRPNGERRTGVSLDLAVATATAAANHSRHTSPLWNLSLSLFPVPRVG